MQQVLTWIGKKVSSRKKRIRLETNNARRPVFEGFESRIMFSYPSPYMDTPVTVDCQGANVTVHGQPDSSGDYPVGYLLSIYDMSGTRLTYWESQMSGQANSYTFPDISAPAGTQYQYAATATYPANGLDPGGTSPSSGMTPFQNVMLDINNGGISQTGVLDINKIDIARADPESGASHAQKYTLTDAGIQIDQGVLAHSGLVYGNGSIIDDQISVGWPGQVGVTLTQSMQNGIDNTAYDLLPHSFTTQIPVGTPQNVTAWVAGVNTTNHKIDVSVNWDAVPGFTYSSITYNVYRIDGDTGAKTQVATGVTGTNYMDEGVRGKMGSTGKPYQYSVIASALDKANNPVPGFESLPSATVNVTHTYYVSYADGSLEVSNAAGSLQHNVVVKILQDGFENWVDRPQVTLSWASGASVNGFTWKATVLTDQQYAGTELHVQSTNWGANTNPGDLASFDVNIEGTTWGVLEVAAT